MTATTSDVEPLLAGALELLSRDPGIGLDELALALVPQEPVSLPVGEAKPFPKLPKAVDMTAGVLGALRRLPKIFGRIHITIRRALSQDEVDELMAEAVTIIEVKAALDGRLEEIKEIVRNHIDVTAEDKGIAFPADVTGPDGAVTRAASPRDKKGHYLLARPKNAYDVPAGPGINWSQQYTTGHTEPDDAMLQAAYAAAVITRDEYLGFTRQLRTFDPLTAQQWIRQHPERGLEILRLMTRQDPANSSLTIRATKN